MVQRAPNSSVVMVVVVGGELSVCENGKEFA